MTATDIASRLDQAHIKLFITDAEHLGLVEAASASHGPIPIITLDRTTGGFPCLDILLAKGHPHYHGFDLMSAGESEAHNAFINRTSGSTGKMKSVLTTHAHWNAVMEATVHTIPQDTDPDADVWLNTIGLGFFIAAKLFMGLNILLGVPVIISRKRFDAASLDLIPKHRVTFLFIPPPLAARIAKSETIASRSLDFSSIKWLLTAGAPMHESLRNAISEIFNSVPVTMEWGTTETLLLAMQVNPSQAPKGSSGSLVTGVEAKVIDIDTGVELGPNEAGEILVVNRLARYAGYMDEETITNDFDSDGFFHSGDYGYIDEEGNVFIVDRLKELLRVGEGTGLRISASDLEAIAFSHPAVRDAVVVGIRDESTQIEHPTAFILLQPQYTMQDSRVLARDIEGFVNSKVGGIASLTGGVFFLPQLPTVGFKVDRRKLKGLVNLDELKDGEGNLTPASRIVGITA
jgi:4-coumarate--CoA ligase